MVFGTVIKDREGREAVVVSQSSDGATLPSSELTEK